MILSLSVQVTHWTTCPVVLPCRQINYLATASYHAAYNYLHFGMTSPWAVS